MFCSDPGLYLIDNAYSTARLQQATVQHFLTASTSKAGIGSRRGAEGDLRLANCCPVLKRPMGTREVGEEGSAGGRAR